MKKKRKKHHPVINEQASREKNKKDYLSRLRQMCIEFAGPRVYELLPQMELDRLYEIRTQIGRVLPATGAKVASGIIKEIKILFSAWLRNNKISAFGHEMTYKDFYSLYLTLLFYAERLKADKFPGAAEFRKPFESYFEFDELYSSAGREINVFMQFITAMYSAFDENIYWSNYESRIDLKNKLGIYICMDIYSHEPEKINVEVEGSSRQAFRLGWGYSNPDPEFHYVEIDDSLLQNWVPVNGKKFPVYIQKHAMQRLYERMDGPFTGFLNHSLGLSVLYPVICSNSQGAFLIEYRYRGAKTGYLRAEIHNDIILIHTFLFLTNNGTPEGEKLQENTGLKKEDKIYLAIDKLSSFINSDIRNNEAIKNIFIGAGCETLFLIDPKQIYLPGEMEEKPLAMRIAQYIGLDMDEEFIEDIENM